MNKNRFRRVFSKRLGMLVAVAEDVVSQGKTPGEGTTAQSFPNEGVLRVVSAMTAFAAAILATQPGVSFAQALPTGGQVTAGPVTVSVPPVCVRLPAKSTPAPVLAAPVIEPPPILAMLPARYTALTPAIPLPFTVLPEMVSVPPSRSVFAP
ncbi:ESPR-type extended signal peptide-containing protein [Caballeronia sp. GAFFF1]|uniref:ESPR-type extended signal peptide-containing protein n=1 Tax=Caballeronia sp. GAFFF1 TaxID=2921779 RepID=UPI0032EEC355